MLEEIVVRLAKREELAEKKAKIYSRLLIDQKLAEDMETLAVSHANRKLALRGEEKE